MQKVLLYYPVITSDSSRRGGSTLATLALASGLAKCSDRFSVAICGDLDDTPPRIDGVRMLRTPQSSKPSACEDFLESFDVVLFTTHLRDFFKVEKPAHQKWILDLHCWNIEPNEVERLSDFDAVLTRSELHSEWLLQSIAPHTIPTYAVGSAYDKSIFYERGKPGDPLKIIFAGAVVPHKGLHILIEAYLRLKQKEPSLSLDIYGSSSIWHSDNAYEDAFRNLALPDVRFLGAVSQEVLAEGLRGAAVLALPSQLESFGLVSVEAQACGCIPVVARTGGSWATFIPGRTGIAYAPNIPEALADALEYALSNQEALQKDGASFVRSNFTVEVVAQKVAAVIDSVVR